MVNPAPTSSVPRLTLYTRPGATRWIKSRGLACIGRRRRAVDQGHRYPPAGPPGHTLSAPLRKYGDVLAFDFGRSVRGILSSREGTLMPRHSPYRIVLSDEERAVLLSLARSYTLPY